MCPESLPAAGSKRPAPASPPSLHLNYRNYCAIISRALIASPQGGYMVNAARASVNRATARFILRSGSAASKGSATTPPSPRCAKISHHQLVSVLPANSNRHKLQLESSVTSRKQTTAPHSNRHKFCPKPAPALRAPAVTTYKSPLTPFLFDTNKTHRIIILLRPLLKTKEKQFSIRYKFARGTATLGCAPRFQIVAPRNHSNQIKCVQARVPVPRGLRLTTHQSPLTNHPVTSPRFSLRHRFMYSAEPMLDLGYVREHLDVIEKMARDRGATLDLAPFRQLDTDRRMVITSAERLKAERNKASEEIVRMKKSGEDASALLALMKQVSDQIKRDDETITVLDEQLKQFLQTVPNIPHASVPVGKSAADNVEVRRWGAPPHFDFKPKAHWELGEGAGILDFDAAIKIAGARFAVYKGLGARLERALANFFLDVHTREHGYTEILPPFLVNTASLTGVGQLPKFAADMFHLEGTDLWLTPTAEVELTSLYRDETLDADLLPIKACAWTACFRSEAGAAGKDTRGIMRQHQFQKVEMFKFTRPEQSYDELETLVRNAEKCLERLGLHYRVMQLCTGDMGFASAKTYDIEVWLPSSNEFMEISSCSNTEAFQARRSGIRFKPKGGKSEYVHTLNGSGLAVGRTWIAIVENFQQADGSVKIPEALRPYMGVDT